MEQPVTVEVKTFRLKRNDEGQYAWVLDDTNEVYENRYFINEVSAKEWLKRFISKKVTQNQSA